MAEHNKLIIHNLSDLSDTDALMLVVQIVSEGRVSGNDLESYCYLTTFTNGYAVSANRNAKSDVFKVYRKGDLLVH